MALLKGFPLLFFLVPFLVEEVWLAAPFQGTSVVLLSLGEGAWFGMFAFYFEVVLTADSELMEELF